MPPETWALKIVLGRPQDCQVACESLAAVLDDLGARGWYETTDAKTGQGALRVFFASSAPPNPTIQRIRQTIAAQRREGTLGSPAQVSVTEVDERDWVGEFRRGFRGIRVEKGLRVVPPWHAGNTATVRRSGAIEILIQPGMAFGTGLHETTRLCLRLLRREIRGGERVADIGAGSGILSIGAVRFGAHFVLAIEADPQAHDNLLENIRLNRVGRRVRVFRGDATQYMTRFQQGRGRQRRDFDLIVCNILFEKMRPLVQRFRDLVRPGHSATVITSGHLWSDRRDAAAMLEPAGVAIRCERKMGDWGAIVGQLSSSSTCTKDS